MAKLTRKTLKVFGSAGANTYFAEFGSQTLGAPVKTKDIDSIQTLSAWINGFQDEVDADKAPYMEDVNSMMYVHSYMVAYLFENGIPEWSATTTYYQGSVVRKTTTFEQYGSIGNNNLGNALPNQTDDANWKFLNPTPPAVPAVGNGLKSNVVMAPNNGAPNTKVDVTADSLSVQGTALLNVNVTADITVSGANGLDTGAPANSTWYAVFVITNSTGSLIAALLSLSGTAPTMPGGYTLFRRVGWVRRNGSGNFVRFRMQGDWVYWVDAAVFSQSTPTGTIDFKSFGVSPTSRIAAFMTADIGGSGGSAYGKVTGTSQPATVIHSFNTIAGNNPSITNHLQFPLNASQQIDLSIAGSIAYTIQTLGYYDPV